MSNSVASDVIRANLEKVRARIRVACERANRPVRDVMLVGASKFQPLSSLQAAAAAGLQDFGENYGQELNEKRDAWAGDSAPVRWHLIGPLQKNKVKLVVGHVDLIHSIDRLDLAQAIGRRAGELSVTQDILLQVKIGGEDSKSGVNPEDTERLLMDLREVTGVRVVGLMALPPPTQDENRAKGFFRQLSDLRNHLRLRLSNANLELHHLSMGTSSDFEWAIECGATIVRVGTLIFGERPRG